MTEVSIIMPYYQKKEYINSSVNSVLNQSFKNFELIIIYDDESTKDLPCILRIARTDKRIKLIINKKNFGAGFSRNIGIKKSKGKFIAFIDSDDLWKPEKLKYQLEFMNKNKLDFTHTSYKITIKDYSKYSIRVAKDIDYTSLIKSCDIGLSTVMVKKDLVTQDLFPKLKTKEDLVAWLKIVKKIKILKGIPEVFCIWRSTKNSLSKSVPQKIFDAFKVYRFYEKFNTTKAIFFVMILSINYLKKKYLS